MNIIPFGDSEAHGAIGNTIVFQRRRGKVFARKYTWKKYTRTTLQDKQRIKFRNCLDNYTALTPAEKEYFDMLAYGKAYTGQNLFMSRCLRTHVPSTTHLNIKKINSLHIDTVRASDTYGWGHEFYGITSLQLFGLVLDRQNVTQANSHEDPAGENIYLIIKRGTRVVNIQAGDFITMNFNGTESVNIYLPELYDVNNFYLYPADDGSTYYDEAMTNLAYASPPP